MAEPLSAQQVVAGMQSEGMVYRPDVLISHHVERIVREMVGHDVDLRTLDIQVKARDDVHPKGAMVVTATGYKREEEAK